MGTIQVAPFVSGICTPNTSQLRRAFHSTPCSFSPLAFDPFYAPSMTQRAKLSYRFQCQPILKPRHSLHVCFAGGQGMMENNGDFQRKSLQEAMEQLKGQSIEDLVRQQIQKGGSGDRPPGGRGGGGGGGGSSSGSDGMSDETLQVVLATVCFILMYIFVINGLELIKLARDCVKFVLGKGQSVRLKRAIYKWVRLYKYIIEKMEAIKNGLEKASTCWFDHDFFRGVFRHSIKSNQA